MSYIFNENDKVKIIRKCGNREGVTAGEEISRDDKLYKLIQDELEYPFHKSAVKLNRCVRKLANNIKGPDALLLSDNEGGFAQRGLIIKKNNQYTEYPDLNYVDLVLDEEKVENGELQIFTHELGHVMISNAIPDFPKGKAVKQHLSTGITDYFTAFDEGFAIHFERLSYEAVPRYRNIADHKYGYCGDSISTWASELDSRLRLEGVKNNIFVHKKVIPDIDLSDMELKDIILLEHTSPDFDRLKLKNAQEMLSSEGVIATIFYRINTNKQLQNNYLDKHFYNKFLSEEIKNDNEIKEVFSPFENVMLKDLWVFTCVKEKMCDNLAPFIEFIKTWCDCFPDDKHEILNIFINTTFGRTITNTAGELFERMSYNGIMGRIEEYIKLLTEYRKLINDIISRVEKGELKLDGNVGKELWIETDNVKIPLTLWSDEEQASLRVNLNTASAYDLMPFTDYDSEKARGIIRLRDEKGYFKNLNDTGIHLKKEGK